MTPAAWLASKYVAFCVVATALNLGSQYLADISFSPPLWLSIGIGTAFGLLAKYVLDRNYIFDARGASAGKDARRFMLYTAMGIITTLVFWGTEWAFAILLPFASAKYLGGAIGLSAGYYLKYQLDRRWVFTRASQN